ERFGAALSQLSPEDKKAMADLQQKVDVWAQEQEKQGKRVDRSSIFVGEAMNYAMNKDPEGKNPQLMGVFDSGAQYIDAYRALQQSQGGQR
ncbi:MAG: hypothetical protein AB1758_31530, partial [Candidatus Eremiobacterota bacterium]